jgi:transcriptional regulator with XRE-family HTH domain
MDRLRFGFFNEFKGDPTLLFFGSRHALRALIDVLLSLRDQETIRLEHDSRFISLGGTEVAVSLTDEPQSMVKCHTAGRYGFAWRLTKKDIIAFVEKIKPLAANSQPCHQYLDGQLGDMTVMVSSGEYPDTLYPDPPESIAARFQYFRERASLSMAEVAEKMNLGMGFTDMCVWDLEAYDNELFSVYSPLQMLRLTEILGITPRELINFENSEPPVTTTELVQLINGECVTRGISLDAFEDVVGWSLNKMMEPSELLLQDMSLEGLTDLCKELRINWVRVINGINRDS